MNFVRRHLIAALALAQFFAFSPALADDCEGRLSISLRHAQVVRQFSQFKYTNHPGKGFSLELPPPAHTQHVSYNRLSRGPLQHLELWNANGKTYQWFDTGFKNLEDDAAAINSIVLNHMYYHPGESLKLYFSPEFIQQRLSLRRHRWALHAAVIELYMRTKPYITPRDLQMMRQANVDSSNSDVFGLLTTDGGVTAGPLTKEDVIGRKALTMQISYPVEKNFFRPTNLGLFEEAGIYPPLLMSRLPFEYRINRAIDPSFIRRFGKRFPIAQTCEFTRYARFVRDLPLEIHNRFLIEIMLTVKKRGMKYIVAAGDPVTTRLFQRYGFKIYSQLPNMQREEKEYLSYIEVDSPEFVDTFNKLLESASSVLTLSEDAGE